MGRSWRPLGLWAVWFVAVAFVVPWLVVDVLLPHVHIVLEWVP